MKRFGGTNEKRKQVLRRFIANNPPKFANFFPIDLLYLGT